MALALRRAGSFEVCGYTVCNECCESAVSSGSGCHEQLYTIVHERNYHALFTYRASGVSVWRLVSRADQSGAHSKRTSRDSLLTAAPSSTRPGYLWPRFSGSDPSRRVLLQSPNSQGWRR